MDEDGIVTAEVLAHLSNGFEEGKRFDVADCPADLDDGDFAISGYLAHGVLNLVGDVRNYLYGFAEVVAASFLGDYLLVDAASGQVVVAREFGVGKALVVAEVEVGLGAVVGDEDFAVLERGHGSRVYVEVRVKLHQIDFDTARLEQATDGSCSESLAE